MKAANGEAATAIISSFEATHELFKQEYPDLAAEGEGSVHESVVSMSRRATFLRAPSTNVAAFRKSMAAFLASEVYRHIPASHLERFLVEVAYPKMAELEGSDVARTGSVAVAPLRSSSPWAPVTEGEEMSWELSLMRLCRVKFPAAYGLAAPDDESAETDLVAYLDAARDTILQVRRIISENMVKDPRAPKEISGSPVGLLLLITHN
jgi:hypothetical protein